MLLLIGRILGRYFRKRRESRTRDELERAVESADLTSEQRERLEPYIEFVVSRDHGGQAWLTAAAAIPAVIVLFGGWFATLPQTGTVGLLLAGIGVVIGLLIWPKVRQNLREQERAGEIQERLERDPATLLDSSEFNVDEFDVE